MKPALTTALALVALALPLSACSSLSEAQTLKPYAAADGVIATAGQLHALNMAVVGGQAGAPGVVSGRLVNDGDQPDQVSVVTEGMQTPAEVTVPPHGAVALGVGDGEQHIQVDSLPRAAGAMVKGLLTSKTYGEIRLNLPVLAAQGPWETLTPSVAPTASLPTASATTEGGTASPTASGTASPTASGEATATTSPTASGSPTSTP